MIKGILYLLLFILTVTLIIELPEGFNFKTLRRYDRNEPYYDSSEELVAIYKDERGTLKCYSFRDRESYEVGSDVLGEYSITR